MLKSGNLFSGSWILPRYLFIIFQSKRVRELSDRIKLGGHSHRMQIVNACRFHLPSGGVCKEHVKDWNIFTGTNHCQIFIPWRMLGNPLSRIPIRCLSSQLSEVDPGRRHSKREMHTIIGRGSLVWTRDRGRLRSSLSQFLCFFNQNKIICRKQFHRLAFSELPRQSLQDNDE